MEQGGVVAVALVQSRWVRWVVTWVRCLSNKNFDRAWCYYTKKVEGNTVMFKILNEPTRDPCHVQFDQGGGTCSLCLLCLLQQSYLAKSDKEKKCGRLFLCLRF